MMTLRFLALTIFFSSPFLFGKDLKLALEKDLDALMPKVIAWRHNIHQYPELSNREYKTAKKVAEHLRSLDIPIETNIAYTGVVGIIEGLSLIHISEPTRPY